LVWKIGARLKQQNLFRSDQRQSRSISHFIFSTSFFPDAVSILAQCYAEKRSMSIRYESQWGDSTWNDPLTLLLLAGWRGSIDTGGEEGFMEFCASDFLQASHGQLRQSSSP
jgi:hypothetical protein